MFKDILHKPKSFKCTVFCSPGILNGMQGMNQPPTHQNRNLKTKYWTIPKCNEQTCSLQLSDSVSLWAYWVWQTVHSISARKELRVDICCVFESPNMEDNYRMLVSLIHWIFANQLYNKFKRTLYNVNIGGTPWRSCQGNDYWMLLGYASNCRSCFWSCWKLLPGHLMWRSRWCRWPVDSLNKPGQLRDTGHGTRDPGPPFLDLTSGW